jgi:hypothetical protein
MAELTNSLKQKLEHLFNMRTGYVLDFTNATFSDFVQTSVGVDVYSQYDNSKANILRQLWHDLDIASVRKLTLEMLDRWETNMAVSGREVSAGDQKIFDSAVEEVKALDGSDVQPSDLEFLERDFGTIDLSQLSLPISHREIIEQRLEEIERCMKAEAPLAVVFLCGSTLEGLLYEVASKNPEAYNRGVAAPKFKGAVKPLADWTLQDLIVTSRELGIIGEDVVKHAQAVKDFRNYIHPRQQLKENFKPRMFTAEMARHVLHAAINDLSSIQGDNDQ